ncbi:MAG: hypothetical protein LBQ13_04340 [Endomicrobium sp.]|jgi:hypothetical protein|nr:hypothetical protein [Endomicrobium sp.]
MAVKEIKQEDKLVLELDNGDLEKFKETIKKWNFIDSQSLLRFAISLMLKTERNVLYIDINNKPEGRIPADHLIKQKDGDNVNG